MRTSNKILAGTLLLILFIITGIHVALYAKYKSNDFTTMKNLHEERYDSYDLKGVQSVSITGIQNVIIISADTARVEIEKSSGDTKLHHEFVNGVFTIKGDTVLMENNGSANRINNYRDVVLYLPKTQIVKSAYCGLTIRGSEDSSNSSSWVLDLKDTELHLGDRLPQGSRSAFDKISITNASGGSIDVFNDARIKEFGLNMESSGFDDGSADFGTISINADSSSVIKISGKNILKTKFTIR
jgi:hypothetical protein